MRSAWASIKCANAVCASKRSKKSIAIDQCLVSSGCRKTHANTAKTHTHIHTHIHTHTNQGEGITTTTQKKLTTHTHTHTHTHTRVWGFSSWFVCVCSTTKKRQRRRGRMSNTRTHLREHGRHVCRMKLQQIRRPIVDVWTRQAGIVWKDTTRHHKQNPKTKKNKKKQKKNMIN